MALANQTKEIEAKRRDVMADLAQVEPAVIEAQTGLIYFYFLVYIYFDVINFFFYHIRWNSAL